MSTRICCQTRSTFLRRAIGASQWVGPTAILALLPKCPACLAGYVLLCTGVGISITTAGMLRTGLLVFGIAVLAFAALRGLTFYFTREINP